MKKMVRRLTLLALTLAAGSCQWMQLTGELELQDNPAWLAGGLGSGPGQFGSIGPGAIDSDGRIVVADNNLKRLTWFDVDGKVFQIRYFSAEAGPPLLPETPISEVLALSSHGDRLYVATGSGIWSVRGSTVTQVEIPTHPGPLRSLAVTDDAIYLLSPSDLTICHRDGSLLATVTLSGDPSPDCRSLALGPDGNLYVTARRWREVLVFDPRGRELRRIGAPGEGVGPFSGSIRGVAVDGWGNVYVRDDGDGNIEIFNAEGVAFRRMGQRGSGPGQTLAVNDILFDGDRDRLVLLDSINRRIQVFDLSGEDTRARDLTIQTTDFPAMPKPDHIVLTLGIDAEKERRVTWRTDPSVTETRAQAVAVPKVASSEVDWSSDSVREFAGANTEFYGSLGLYHAHQISLTDLEPGSSYAYRVGSPRHWSETLYFELPKDPNRNLTVVAMGDSRNRMDVWSYIVNASAREKPAFIINTGDLVSNGDDMSDWNAWFHEARQVFDRIPLMPCLGNHERQSPNYFLAFALPENGPDDLREEAYSFDYGPAHWVVLNTENDLQKQAEWLEEDLKSHDRPWTFAFFHRPAYAGHPTRGDGNVDVREAWSGLLERYGVDIAWQGHDHYYFRTRPIRAAAVVAPGEGPLYVTTGGAGAPLYAIELNPYAEVAESVDHFCVLKLTPQLCEVTVYRADTTVLDRFQLKPRRPDSWLEAPVE